MRGVLQALSEIDSENEEGDAKQQGIEGEFQGGDSLQERAVDRHNVDGIKQRGGHHQKYTHQAQRVSIISLIEQTDAT